jgi:hypothetical protein
MRLEIYKLTQTIQNQEATIMMLKEEIETLKR